jgi:hypothetical protein
MYRRLRRFVLLAASLCAALPSLALLIRADRDDAEYVELASRYGSALSLRATGGEGVLIAPRWVLTSARVGKSLLEMKPRPAVQVQGREIPVESVFVHPAWVAGSSSSDLALVLLSKVAGGVTPTPLYRDDDEGGKGVVIVGHGDTGEIGGKTVRQDRKKRGAINTVDRVSPRTFALAVKAGDEASDLQGALTAGESGAPAYIETRDRELFVAGIASAAEDLNSNGVIDAGDAQVFVRVSAFVPWIEATMLQAIKEELNRDLDGSNRS